MPLDERSVAEQAAAIREATEAARPLTLFRQLMNAEDELQTVTFEPRKFFLRDEVERLRALYTATTTPAERRADYARELADANFMRTQAEATLALGHTTIAQLALLNARAVRLTLESAKESVATTRAARDDAAAANAAEGVSLKKVALFAALTLPAWAAYLFLKR